MIPTIQDNSNPQASAGATALSENKPVIAFIGAGNMAEAVIGGLYASGHPSTHLRFSEPFDARREYMESKFPQCMSTTDNNKVIDGADVVILAVKPQVLRQVVSDLKFTDTNVLIISIAAGIKTEHILRWLETPQPVVRCMPNTPALIGEGAVGLYATESVNDAQRDTTVGIMSAVAKRVMWVDKEAAIDTITAMSGSGPAYYFLFMEAMTNAGVAAGLTPEEANDLTVQTCLGAAKMAQQSEDDLATLRKKVTSPNGTTEAALKTMEAANIRQIIHDGVFSAERRSREIADEMGRDQ
ncbi:pyrroline-5-carboxylate reductase [Zychaea mexicana]|uniref:pyrroline-5-carboxylate reductase n=1 Tax=Zychaea mexicana TaxID=64656 RepID=UPI0022FEB6C9|nr:pyrroline-5-carboxylate reductase [Zychaea mexicana]KAI9490562.1 pyrroline-5-carboxylate reductase [Zychaea mexicana]